MNSIGSPNISNLPPQNRKQLFAMLVFYLGDGNQDVRINTKKAILTLEYGNNPLGGRQKCEELIRSNIKNTYD